MVMLVTKISNDRQVLQEAILGGLGISFLFKHEAQPNDQLIELFPTLNRVAYPALAGYPWCFAPQYYGPGLFNYTSVHHLRLNEKLLTPNSQTKSNFAHE